MIKTIEECFFQIQNGANIKQGDMGGGFPITRIETTANDKFNRDRMGYAGITDISKYELYVLEDGDLLMSHINSAQYLGRTVLYVKQPNETIIHGMNLLRLKARRDIIDPAYARYCFCGHPFRNQIGNITKKSVNQASFAVKDLKQIIIDIPTVPEQLGIVEILDKIQQIIELRTDEMAKLDNLIKARFVEMFGDPIRNTQNRPTTEFINVVKMQRGFDLPVQDRKQDGDVPVYGSNGALDRHNIAKVQGGGVITGRSGTIGKVFYTERDYWPLNTSLFSVDTHGNNVIYLAYLLQMYNLTRFVEGTGVPTLNRNKFHNKQIVDVPRYEQQQFANFVYQVDKSKVAVQKALDETQLLFDSLMQQYFG